jgi:hypothetical protein
MGAMSWAQDLLGFGGGNEGAASGPETLDQARFGYSPELVGNLKGDHAYLLRRYQEIERLALKGELAAIPMALAGFKNKFDLHLLNENLQFYCHLEQRSARRPADLARIREFRTEMNAIARAVVNFVKKYRLEGVRPETVQAFLGDLRAVGAALVQRIAREEKDLYPLYAP